MHDYEKESEQILVRRARRGDVKAFSELYSRIYVELYKFALYTLKHPQDAEDAVSETVTIAFEKLVGLRKQEAFRSWIFTILSNQCRKKFQKMQTEELPEELSTEADLAGNHEARRVFQELEEEDRLIVALAVFGGYRSPEIAAVMQMNPTTVRSRKSRAFAQMRKSLE